MGDIILNKFFIILGGLFLHLIDFFNNNPFKNINEDKNDENIQIFNKLEIDKKSNPKNKIETIREKILPFLLNKSTILILAIILAIMIIFIDLEIVLMFLVIMIMFYIYMIYYPKIQTQRNYGDLNQELPYALRHIGIELKSGKGLHDSFITIRNSNYGSLSIEFKRVLEEINYGKSTEEALLDLSHRINSDGLSRAIKQIIGTLRVGGNLASNLEIIADDIIFDMHIKLKEYSEKLNSFILIYTFIAILLPVITLIMLMAATTVMGDIISNNVIMLLYSVFFPFLVVFMGVIIKKFEPKI